MGKTPVQEVFGLLGAIVVLAMISVVVINGHGTAQAIGAGGAVFTNGIKAANHPMQGKGK